MYSVRFRTLTALTTSFIRLSKYNVSGFNRYYSKAHKYYAGFTASVSDRLDTLKQCQRGPIVLSSGSLSEKLKSFKTQLSSFEDPLKKYDYLMCLRDQDIDLYYHFLRNNTGEVLALFYAVDGVIRNFEETLPISQTVVEMSKKKKKSKPLDIKKTVELLRKRIQKMRQGMPKQKPESESDSKSGKNKDPFKWIKKQIVISPNKSFMIYLMTNNLK